MAKRYRSLAAVLAALLAAVMLFSVFFIVLEAGHDCDGEDCAVCAVLSVCENLLRELFRAAAGIVLLAAAARAASFMVRAYPPAHGGGTLVSLKVKLSD